jgi:peptidyl-prolyl cis-trans isomerase D
MLVLRGPARMESVMFDLIDKYRKTIMIGIFLLIIPPFAFFGIDSYFQGGAGSSHVATVGGSAISQAEFSEALREQQDALQRRLGGRLDASLLDSPQIRSSVLENLVQQRVLADRAYRLGLRTTDRQVQALVGEMDAFKEDGRFSLTRYEALLKQQGMTPTGFEARLRQDMVLRQLSTALSESAFVSRAEAAQLLRVAEQKREIGYVLLSPERFTGQVKLEADAVRKYYDSHQDEFRIPEQVRVETVELSAATLAAGIKPSPEEVRKVYDSNSRRYVVNETRQASHILIAGESGNAEARKAAKAKIEELYARLKKEPKAFPALAKQFSQDPGSAARGGDLGFFERGAMVKAFDDVVFGMKPGELSAPVETEFGYHLIQLTAVRGGKAKTFEEARAEIEADLKQQMAARRFAELADKFSNVLFEQSDSLKGAADLVQQAPQKSDWISREGNGDRRLSHPRLLQAIFSSDVLKDKRNSEAVEVAPGVLVAARVIEHKPSSIRPFEQVSAELAKTLTLRQASQLAAQEGRSQLAALRAGKPADLKWTPGVLAGRNDPKGIPGEILQLAYKADTGKLPAFGGGETPGGFALIRITKVEDPRSGDKAQENAIGQTLRQLSAQAEFAAYVASLRQKMDVKIRQDALEKK